VGSSTPSAVADQAGPAGEPTFEQIHEEYRPRIRRFLTRLVGPVEAEDLTQLVFFRASQALPEFRGDSSLATWLYRIARNAAADWRRSASRMARMQDELMAAGGAAGDVEPAAASAPAEDALMRREVQQCLRGVIARLPDADRDVLALHELDGLPHAAVAEVLGVSVPAAKVRLHRARARLRNVLAASCNLSRDSDGLGCESKRGAGCCAA
jgi:RNA polymerase sigma-70 factor (ECF subfamily)